AGVPSPAGTGAGRRGRRPGTHLVEGDRLDVFDEWRERVEDPTRCGVEREVVSWPVVPLVRSVDAWGVVPVPAVVDRPVRLRLLVDVVGEDETAVVPEVEPGRLEIAEVHHRPPATAPVEGHLEPTVVAPRLALIGS